MKGSPIRYVWQVSKSLECHLVLLVLNKTWFAMQKYPKLPPEKYFSSKVRFMHRNTGLKSRLVRW